jgi:hypothetical protein
MVEKTDMMELDNIEVPEATPCQRLTLVYRLLNDINRRRRHSLQAGSSADEVYISDSQAEPSVARPPLAMREEDTI